MRIKIRADKVSVRNIIDKWGMRFGHNEQAKNANGIKKVYYSHEQYTSANN